MNLVRRLRVPFIRPLWAVAIGLVAATACAKAPTVVNVQLSADTTVPPLLLLRTTIARPALPDVVASTTFLSRAAKGEAGLPGPFVFPLVLPVNVPPGWAGDVEIVVEGLSSDTAEVVARGRASATAVRETTTEASAALTAVSGGGGTDGGATADGGADGKVTPGGGDGGDAGSPDAVD